ncbi:MAG: hypothetical protein ACK4L4_14990 [Gemmobacter sp.]
MIRAALALAMTCGPALGDRFALTCDFAEVCGANLICGNGSLRLVYEVDRDSHEVFLIDGEARVGVSAAQGDAALSFHSHLPTGGFQSTTFTAGGAAVHSRHIVIDGKLAPSQHYGTCMERRMD